MVRRDKGEALSVEKVSLWSDEGESIFILSYYKGIIFCSRLFFAIQKKEKEWKDKFYSYNIDDYEKNCKIKEFLKRRKNFLLHEN